MLKVFFTKKYKRKILCCCLSVIIQCYASLAYGGDVSRITGNWITFDDKSGQKRSIVTITEKNGQLSGRVIKVFFKPGEETRCVKCEGENHNKNIVGIEIFKELTFDGKMWQGSTILDPENGKEYRCELQLAGETLKVRGYLYLFFRNQQWKKYEQIDSGHP